MSKFEIATNAKGVTSVRDTSTGESEVVNFSGSAPSKKLSVTAESSPVAAHIFYRTDAAETA